MNDTVDSLKRILRKPYWKVRGWLMSFEHSNVEIDLWGKYSELGKKAGFQSQRGQDYYLVNNFLKDVKNGFFVDIGANHPVNDNNTYYLEKKMGWSGISIDAQDRYMSLWSQERTTPLVHSLVGEKSGETFTFQTLESDSWHNMLSGVNIANNSKVNLHKNEVSKIKATEMESKTLVDILKDRHVTTIDTLFIDVEGFEMNVLKGIDFGQLDIKYICLENDNNDGEIRNYLRVHGFQLVSHLRGDDIYKRILQ